MTYAMPDWKRTRRRAKINPDVVRSIFSEYMVTRSKFGPGSLSDKQRGIIVRSLMEKFPLNFCAYSPHPFAKRMVRRAGAR